MIIPLLVGAGLLLVAFAGGKRGAPGGAPGGADGGDSDGLFPKVPKGTDAHVDPAFVKLAADAAQTGDKAKSAALADDAQARGLNTTADAIRVAAGMAPVTNGARNVATAVPVEGRKLLKLGSTGADVIEWQRILHIKPDGIFGPTTDASTRVWQRLHGQLVDGVVGPRTWAAAYAVLPVLAATPPIPAVAPPITVKAATPAPAPQAAPGGAPTAEPPPGPAPEPKPAPGPAPWPLMGKDWAGPAPAENDQRAAAAELTAYLQGIGGLAGRFKESKPQVATWLARIGQPDPRGYYGRNAARAICMLGLVPVAPFYWPTVKTAAAKAEWLALVDKYAAADPQRAAEWKKLRADSVRS